MAALTRGLLGLALLGCGDPLVQTAYEGEPVFVHHQMVLDGAQPPDAVSPRWGVFWLRGGFEAGNVDDGVEQPGTSRPAVRYLGALRLYAPPAPALLATTAGGGRYGIGSLLLYDDRDGDRLRGPDEPILGTSQQALVYAPADLDAQASPTRRPLPAGFHVTRFPLPCEPTRDGTEDCGLPIGDPCVRAGDCGAEATCWRELGPGFPGGMCVGTGSCEQSGTVRYETSERRQLYVAWLPACAEDADCRVAAGYHCDQLLRACHVDAPISLTYGEVPTQGLCRDPLSGLGDRSCDGVDCVATCPAEARGGCVCGDRGEGPVCAARCRVDRECDFAPNLLRRCVDGICH
ncbi:MAG: hypothetical protein H6706_31180 [Myxococcales bacterium]|nr:hypothetical protein [Myxococcales bacterium]